MKKHHKNHKDENVKKEKGKKGKNKSLKMQLVQDAGSAFTRFCDMIFKDQGVRSIRLTADGFEVKVCDEETASHFPVEFEGHHISFDVSPIF